jgi:curved DNA-binding protein CbpA
LATRPQYPQQSYYDLLGVAPSASRGELRAAYLHRMDQARANGSAFPRQSKFLNEAYEVLLDEQRRAAYDRYLAEPVTNEPRPAEAAPPGEPRTASRRPEPASDIRRSNPGTRPSGRDSADDGYSFDFAMSRTPSSSNSSSFLDLINSFQMRKYRIGRRRSRARSRIIAFTPAIIVTILIICVVIWLFHS